MSYPKGSAPPTSGVCSPSQRRVAEAFHGLALAPVPLGRVPPHAPHLSDEPREADGRLPRASAPRVQEAARAGARRRHRRAQDVQQRRDDPGAGSRRRPAAAPPRRRHRASTTRVALTAVRPISGKVSRLGRSSSSEGSVTAALNASTPSRFETTKNAIQSARRIPRFPFVRVLAGANFVTLRYSFPLAKRESLAKVESRLAWPSLRARA